MGVTMQLDWLSTLGIIAVYIGTGTIYSLGVRASRDETGVLPYEPAAAALCIEFIKLSLAVIMQIKSSPLSFEEDIRSLVKRWSIARWFVIPAWLYAVFNVLAFYNLQLVEPPTYRLLINSKVIWSGLLLHFFLGTKLNARKWFALVLLATACGVEQFSSFNIALGFLPLVLVPFQAFCSSLAGVMFQWLLQRPQERNSDDKNEPELGLWEKNIFLYSWGCLFQVAYILTFNPTALTVAKFQQTFSPLTIFIIFVNACGGLSTSLLLKYLDVVIKEYANFVEMVVVVLFSAMMFATPVSALLLVAVGLAGYSMYLYNVDVTPVAPTSPSVIYQPVTQEKGNDHVSLNVMDPESQRQR